MDHDIVNRLQRLEDIESIRELKHAYCYACDDNYNVSQLKPLFAQVAIWRAEGFGHYTGPDEIGDFFAGVANDIIAAAHLVMNDIITISDDGLTATGKWRNSQPVTTRDKTGQPQALWMLAKYDEKYVKHDGRWLFQELVATIQYSAPYEEGWAKLWPV